MRAQLLLATIILQSSIDKEESAKIAFEYAKSGGENSIRYGNGLFDWAFDNLKAVIALNEFQNKEEARLYFSTCYERLKRRGLLFLGNWDAMYPNYLAISNVIRFFGSFSETDGLKYIKSIQSYDNDYAFSQSIQRHILKNCLNSSPIFSNKSKTKQLKYPNDKFGYFTPIY